MNNDYACSNLNSILDILKDIANVDNDIIEDCLAGLNHVIEYASSNCVKKISNKNNSYKEKRSNNLWYDQECKNKRKEFEIARDKYLHTLQDIDLKSFCCIRNAYRKLCRKKRSIFQMNKAKD